MRECPRCQVFAHVYFYSTSRIYLHVIPLRVAARSLQPLKRLVISVRCVWPRVCELRAVWASCSLCLLFTAGEARRWMRLRVPIAPLPSPPASRQASQGASPSPSCHLKSTGKCKLVALLHAMSPTLTDNPVPTQQSVR